MPRPELERLMDLTQSHLRELGYAKPERNQIMYEISSVSMIFSSMNAPMDSLYFVEAIRQVANILQILNEEHDKDNS